MLIEGRAPAGHRAGGKRRLERFEFLEKSLRLLQVGLEIDLLLGIGSPHDLLFELLDLLRQGRELPGDMRDTADTGLRVSQVLPSALRDNNFQIGRRLSINLIALP